VSDRAKIRKAMGEWGKLEGYGRMTTIVKMKLEMVHGYIDPQVEQSPAQPC
jgi:hypothetical protein